MEIKYNVYLAGEIHSDWRNDIISTSETEDLPVAFEHPEVVHAESDKVGLHILGGEDNQYWDDRKSALINSIRIGKGIDWADIVVVKFGEEYKQWNAAFDAGYAAAKGKALIVIHPEQFDHALKEIDAASRAVCRDDDQVVELLKYLCRHS